mgnify:CR=1 FL=1
MKSNEASTRAGSRYVQFVIAAPNREQVSTLRRDPVFYGDSYTDWAPYQPGLRDPLAAYARSIAENQRFDAEIGGIDELSERIDRANRNNHVVVLLVDAWAARVTAEPPA